MNNTLEWIELLALPEKTGEMDFRIFFSEFSYKTKQNNKRTEAMRSLAIRLMSQDKLVNEKVLSTATKQEVFGHSMPH